MCSACHGFAGNTPGLHVPVLAGMNANYFKKAIKDYAEGKRPSPEMEPYSKYVLQFGLDQFAEYFASQKKPMSANVKVEAKALSRGATLATQCVACHGPKGDGDAERNTPALRGQGAGFLQVQMNLFAGDKRTLEDAASEETQKRIFNKLATANETIDWPGAQTPGPFFAYAESTSDLGLSHLVFSIVHSPFSII